jgi:predicted dehydrogenase
LELVEACASAGKAVQLAKPVASTMGVAEKILEVREQSGIPVCINQNCRYNPAAHTIKQLLAPERLGRPLIIELQQYWRGDPKPADDLRPGWMQHVIHHADLLRWWIDSPCVSVYSKCQQLSTMTIYTFANGALAYHMENHSGVIRNDNAVRVQTEKGVVHAKLNWDWHLGNSERRDVVEVFRDTREPGVAIPLPMLTYEPVWSDINKWMPHQGPYYDLGAPCAGMMGCLGSIMRGLSAGTLPDNDISGGVKSLRMALAAEISNRSGQPVNPADVPSDYTTVTEPPL